MRISEIRVGERHRKDLGDIDALARSIAEIGLLHPVVVRPDGLLIAGERRLAACRRLGWDDVPTREIDLDAVVRGEYAENACRKDFAPSEAVAIAEALEPLERAAAEARQQESRANRGENFTPRSDGGKALDKVADAVGMSRPTYEKAKAVVEAARENPGMFGQVAEQMDQSGNVSAAFKQMNAVKTQSARRELAASAGALPASDRYRVEVASIRDYLTFSKFDFIITDPPYPAEYLDLYDVLAERASEWLQPNGLILAMCGQSYFDDIVRRMSAHLTYYWTAAYLTPGQPTPLRTRQVNTSWKPVLIYGLPDGQYRGKIFGDVWRSDANDKQHHKWGQSESGMLSLIQQVCLPGQTIFDPFCGAGTTGVAALRHGCLFEGIDIDAENVNITKARLAEVANDAATE